MARELLVDADMTKAQKHQMMNQTKAAWG